MVTINTLNNTDNNTDNDKNVNNTSSANNTSNTNIKGNTRNKKTRSGSIDIRKMVSLAVFTAVAYVCVYVFHIKVSFLTFDIKDAVITVAAMIFGPMSAVPISLAVSFIEMVTISDTQLYGFVMNVLSTVSFSVTASFIYKYKRSMLGAVMGLITGVLTMTAVMMAANLLITPFYMGVTTKEVAALIPKLLLPFNFTKAVLNASLVLLIYKPIITALRRAGAIKAGHADYGLDKKTVLVIVVAVCLAAASIVVFITVLGGKFEWLR